METPDVVEETTVIEEGLPTEVVKEETIITDDGGQPGEVNLAELLFFYQKVRLRQYVWSTKCPRQALRLSLLKTFMSSQM